MKNKPSKLVISMLITSFVMPTLADAKIKGRRRTAGAGSDRVRGASSRNQSISITGTGNDISLSTHTGNVFKNSSFEFEAGKKYSLNEFIKSGLNFNYRMYVDGCAPDGLFESSKKDVNGRNGTFFGSLPDSFGSYIRFPENVAASCGMGGKIFISNADNKTDNFARDFMTFTVKSSGRNILQQNTGKGEVGDKTKAINSAIAELNAKIDEARSVCSGISGALNTIYGLDVATTVVSAVGTATAGGALAVGLIKNKKEKDILNANQQKESFNSMINENLAKSEEMEEYNKSVKKYNAELAKGDRIYKALGEDNTPEGHNKLKKEYEEQEKIIEKARQWMLNREKDLEVAKNRIASNNEMDNKQNLLGDDAISKNLKNVKTLGHVRTGLMAASIATSGTSLGTSAAASVNAGKVAEKMKQCNTIVGEIRTMNGKVKALISDYKEETNNDFVGGKAEMETANNIVSNCKGFDIAGINAIKNSMTASAVISGIGTGTAIAGTTTSAIVSSGKVEGDKQKKLDLTSNIMAGITTGTSLTTTAVSGAVIGKVKTAIAVAKTCESAL